MSKETNSWQTCPRCKGSGKQFNLVYTGNVWLDMACNLPSYVPDGNGGIKVGDPVCPVCQGKMIISTLTGLPPNEKV